MRTAPSRTDRPHTRRRAAVALAGAAMTLAALPMTVAPHAEAAGFEYNLATSYKSQTLCKVVPAVPQGGVGDGGGCFAHDGDLFIVADTAQDGKSVGIHWRTSGGRSGICRNDRGYDSASYRGRQCDKDLPEGELLYMRAGFCNWSPSNTCQKVSDYTNWGVQVRTYTHKGGAW